MQQKDNSDFSIAQGLELKEAVEQVASKTLSFMAGWQDREIFKKNRFPSLIK